MDTIKLIQEEVNAHQSQVLNILNEIRRTLWLNTGRAFYPRYEIHQDYPDGEKATIWQGIQMVKTLPWWERILAFFSKRGRIAGMKLVGQTDDLYAVQAWVVGGDRSLLRIG